MLPFDIRHFSRNAVLNFDGKWQSMADFQTSDFGGVSATDELDELSQRPL
jgi:hypothetical protein